MLQMDPMRCLYTPKFEVRMLRVAMCVRSVRLLIGLAPSGDLDCGSMHQQQMFGLLIQHAMSLARSELAEVLHLLLSHSAAPRLPVA